MLRHPNYSGMQMDQITRLYIPADFVKTLEIRQGGRLLLSVEGGISISENPSFRFSFRPDQAIPFRVDGSDSAGQRFSNSFPADQA
jgi:sulfur-oxidizing protein SoxY